MIKKSKSKVNGIKIKVQLDQRTVITVNNTKAIDMWLVKYPNLKVID